MNILLIEPYWTGSHRAWADGFRRNSSHDVEILSLPGCFWKWRMEGGAIELSKRYMANFADRTPDLILATDMLDLPTFLALTRRATSSIPTAVYFHENQLAYPWNKGDRDAAARKEKRFALINYRTALAADSVLFNSAYNMESLLWGLPNLLKHFPDHNGLDTVDAIRSKSKVLPLGLDLKRLDTESPEIETDRDGKPLILWNHRWEYDKNPKEFFASTIELMQRGTSFNLAILGECVGGIPPEFVEAKEALADRIVHWGYANTFEEYAHWLWRSDVLPVTSNHDFFGASVVEAAYCGCMPLLPRRMAYPEIFQPEKFPELYYDDCTPTGPLTDRLEVLLAGQERVVHPQVRERAADFDWSIMAKRYDVEMEAIVNGV